MNDLEGVASWQLRLRAGPRGHGLGMNVVKSGMKKNPKQSMEIPRTVGRVAGGSSHKISDIWDPSREDQNI